MERSCVYKRAAGCCSCYNVHNLHSSDIDLHWVVFTRAYQRLSYLLDALQYISCRLSRGSHFFVECTRFHNHHSPVLSAYSQPNAGHLQVSISAKILTLVENSCVPLHDCLYSPSHFEPISVQPVGHQSIKNPAHAKERQKQNIQQREFRSGHPPTY